MKPAHLRGFWLGLAGILSCASAFPADAADHSLEYAVKATYLAKFEPFIEWPAGAFASAISPFNLCIIGSDPFGAELDHAVEGQHVGNHVLAVRRLPAAARDSDCQLMFFGGSSGQSIAQALALVRGTPVLTITDAAASGAAGIINFAVIDDKVRFQIDNDSAAKSGLAISSKLLSLAVSVKPRS